MKLLYYFKNVLLFHEKTNFKMHNIKFNVVLFHEGKYDEKLLQDRQDRLTKLRYGEE